MVFKNIKRIKNLMPEVEDVVMFYNNGIVFQTTFSQSLNIPKLGENLAELLNRVKLIYSICNFKIDDYKKLIFETSDKSFIVLKLGEDSNIALFFKKEEDINKNLKTIRRYIKNIEELIDMNRFEIDFQELDRIEEEIKELQSKQNNIQQKISELESTIEQKEPALPEDKVNVILKEIKGLNEETSLIKETVDKKLKESDAIKEKIEREKKK